MRPDYQSIYSDIIEKKFPHKKEVCVSLLQKSFLSVQDIIKLNKKIFGKEEDSVTNQKHRSYTQSDIKQILGYQLKHQLNNKQLATHFKISRNTITKWKKMFAV